MTVHSSPTVEHLVAALFDLQRRAHACSTSEALGFSMVNDSQEAFGYRHAALVIDGQARALTAVSTLEKHAPFVAFVERLAAGVEVAPGPAVRVVEANSLPTDLRQDWAEFSAAQALWISLSSPKGEVLGGIWMARDKHWHPAEISFLNQLAETYGHAWTALRPMRRWRRRVPTPVALVAVVGVIIALCIPVRQTVLAPAEVVPRDSLVVTAPLDGVVARFEVKPNQQVRAGDVLVRFEDTALNAQADVAERSLQVAEAELRSNSQRAFADAESGARVELLSARAAQKRTERDYAKALLARAVVRSDRDGVAVYADPDLWVGRPVQTGERLMEVADPGKAKVRVDVGVGDLIDLKPGSSGELFPDNDPLSGYPLQVRDVAYESQPIAGGQVAYRVDADLLGEPARLGVRGTAKLAGERVPLAFYLFRRPIAALRQYVGL